MVITTIILPHLIFRQLCEVGIYFHFSQKETGLENLNNLPRIRSWQDVVELLGSVWV